MVTIVLVEPHVAGNIGAVARVMKNFDVDELVLVNPLCEYNVPEAVCRAKHAQEVLKNAKVVKSFIEITKKFDCVIATTSKVGSDYNIMRSPVNPEQCAELIHKKKNVCLVFGRENEGLLNKEIALCDFVVSIPASKKYSALNLSHAVAVMLYTLFISSAKESTTSHFTFASEKEKEMLLKMVNKKIEQLPFTAESKRRTQRIIWKRMIGKSLLTRREIFALFGFFKKLK